MWKHSLFRHTCHACGNYYGLGIFRYLKESVGTEQILNVSTLSHLNVKQYSNNYIFVLLHFLSTKSHRNLTWLQVRQIDRPWEDFSGGGLKNNLLKRMQTFPKLIFNLKKNVISALSFFCANIFDNLDTFGEIELTMFIEHDSAIFHWLSSLGSSMWFTKLPKEINSDILVNYLPKQIINIFT
jgi:hypothetical protein